LKRLGWSTLLADGRYATMIESVTGAGERIGGRFVADPLSVHFAGAVPVGRLTWGLIGLSIMQT
jgi:hypothetical protein